MSPEVLGIIGVFISMALTVNGIFIKSLVDSLAQVKTQTAILLDRSGQTQERLAKLDEEVVRLRDSNHGIRNELGGRLALLEQRVEPSSLRLT